MKGSSVPTSPSAGMIALMDYVSSPSSTSSWDAFFFADLPQILISTGGRTQTQESSYESYYNRSDSARLLWIKKPALY